MSHRTTFLHLFVITFPMVIIVVMQINDQFWFNNLKEVYDYAIAMLRLNLFVIVVAGES